MGLVVIFLTLAGLLTQLSLYYQGDYPLKDTLVRLFDVGGENSVPTWYSSLALLLCSALLALLARESSRVGDRFTKHWAILAVIFAGLSMDEVASLHESLSNLGPLLRVGEGLLYYAWVIPGGLFVLVVALAYLGFLAALPMRTRMLFIAAAGLFVSGALGAEMISARQADLYGKDEILYPAIKAVEELLEMLGVLVFLYALLSHAASYVGAFRVAFEGAAEDRRENLRSAP